MPGSVSSPGWNTPYNFSVIRCSWMHWFSLQHKYNSFQIGCFCRTVGWRIWFDTLNNIYIPQKTLSFPKNKDYSVFHDLDPLKDHPLKDCLRNPKLTFSTSSRWIGINVNSTISYKWTLWLVSEWTVGVRDWLFIHLANKLCTPSLSKKTASRALRWKTC